MSQPETDAGAATSPPTAAQLPAGRAAAPDRSLYRALDADHILATLLRLQVRIRDRFPESGIGRVCAALVTLGEDARTRAAAIGRPLVAFRIVAGAFVGALLVASSSVFLMVRVPDSVVNASELFPLVEAAINDIVMMGAAVFFLFTLETRVKRRRALQALHELRSVAHIIDMHQLTKDPERLLQRGPTMSSSPRHHMTPFELSRYLDYCSEMLSLTGKIAALYVQCFDDPVVLAGANEVESLCTDLSRKIWQKIIILQSFALDALPAPKPAASP